MISNSTHLAELNSPNQNIRAAALIYDSQSTLVQTCTCDDILSIFTIDRVGEGKFFGYGISQKLKVSLVDINRTLDIPKDGYIIIHFYVNDVPSNPFPSFYINTVERDETSNELVITAYDKLYQASNYTIADLSLTTPYTIQSFVAACAEKLEITFSNDYFSFPDESQNLSFENENGANFEGTEDLRQALNAAAEATQSIYYLDHTDSINFKRLDNTVESQHEISKNQYYDLKNKGELVLGKVVHTTELGDNVEPVEPSNDTQAGVIQYIRDNPFWSLRDDIGTLVDKAQSAVGGVAANEIECSWSGNYLLEPTDKISFVTEDDQLVTAFLLDDVINYDGTLSETTKWAYNENDAETYANPTSLGDALNKTFAKVDKANKKITLVVNDVNAIKANTESELQTIKEEQTSITQTATDISIRVESIETTGATKVKTGTGFTFDEEGLRIKKDESGIENRIDNTGMYVKQDGAEVLAVNEVGVKAKDLHAVTYLWIGSHSRFEDYEGGRTGCFWISK